MWKCITQIHAGSCKIWSQIPLHWFQVRKYVKTLIWARFPPFIYWNVQIKKSLYFIAVSIGRAQLPLFISLRIKHLDDDDFAIKGIHLVYSRDWEANSLMSRHNSFWKSLIVESKAIWERHMIHWSVQGNKQDGGGGGGGEICQIE